MVMTESVMFLFDTDDESDDVAPVGTPATVNETVGATAPVLRSSAGRF